MSISIIKLLEKRQVSPWNGNAEYVLARSVQKRTIRLATILNRCVLNGHVFLGFSHRGDCVISYWCHSGHCGYKYWLYWWHFDMHKELVLVSKFELFKHEAIDSLLYITMHEDGTNAYILGCRNTGSLESKPCYVSILPSQSLCKSPHSFSIHFKFELLLPVPCVFMTMSPGCLLLNTGISLLCVVYEVSSEKDLLLSQNHYSSCTHLATQRFGVTRSSTHQTASGASMAMKVFDKHEVMSLLDVSEQLPGDGIVVTDTALDVDSWISRVLPLVLREEHFEYQCLCDYNLKVIEMDKHYSVTFIVMAIVQVSSDVKLPFMKCAVTLVGRWHVLSGSHKLLHASYLQHKASETSEWLQILSNINRRHHLLTHPYFHSRRLSNKSIFTGNSLQAINHPHLPVILVL